jgi:predicted phage baseplate assembly protein
LTVQQKCGTEERRKAVKDSSNLNGIDYLEIFTLKQQLNSIYRPLVLVHCLKDIASLELAEKNVRIEGGIRIKDIKVEWLQKAQDLRKKIESHHEDVITKDLTEEERKTIINAIASDPDNTFVIRLSNIGDFSTYTLRLISVRNNSIGDDTDHGGIPSTLENFDTILSKIDFAFRLECRNDIDCIRDVNEWPSESFTEPVIDYMAKDFASFRRLMLDRLSAIMPTWKARNPADLGIVLVELLAYVGDHLSYFQDAVATESYLGTARKRISVKRHARLLDYFLHEGCNARAWVCFELVTNSQSNNDDQGLRIPKKTTLLSGMYLKEGTSSKDQLPSSVLNIGADGVVVNGVENFNNELAAGAEAFETMHEVTIYKQNNSIEFYTWSGTERFIPKGATRATLNADGLDQDILFRWNKIDSVAEDETRLLKFLKNSFNLDWIDKAKIERISAMYFNWNYIPKSPDNDDSDFKHLRQILKEGFQVEWIDDPNVARENENKKIKLSTTNTDEPKVSIELNNEPLKATRATLTIERNNNTPDIRKDEFIVIANNTKGTVKLYDKSWPGSINTDSQGKSYGDGQIYLDNKYQGILQSPSGNERASRGSSDREENNNKQGSATSWIVLKGESDSDAAAAAAYKITKVNERTMADFSLSSAVTGLVIDMIDDNHDRLSKFRLRESTAYVLSEKLELAEQSISHPVGDNTNSIMLDRMVDGLTVGQLVAISGQLVDQPGVVKNEIAVLSDIVHFEAGTTFTTLYFTKNLVYRYRRDTVTLNANVIRATHGETKQEVIGSWDQSSQQQQQQQPQMQQQQQRFVLKQKPLTYMYAPTSRGVKSTLELRVNEILWKEVDRLYDLKPTDHAYITRTDDDGQTYVVFGDGIKGARPASGMENIVAKYRVGIGTVGMLNESQITLLMNRPLGVRSVINPIAPAGAADPEDLDNARQNASLTVLAMDRIVSFTDCENFVRSFAGIGKAQATLINSSEKKTFVIVTIMSSIGQAIEPTSDLYKNLLEAIDAAKDPLIQIGLGSFNQKLFNIEAKILVAKDRRFENVKANVEAALYNVFSFNSRQFSQSVTLSEIIAIIEKVEGVVATDIDALYLFDPSPALLSWKNVLDGDEKFVDFLEKNVKIDWIEKWKNQTKHEVNRSIDQNQIAIFFEKNSLYCTLIRKKNRVRFDIVNVSSDSGISSSSDDSQYEFVIKQNGDTPDKLSISKMRLVKSIPAKRSSPTKTNFGGLVQPDLLTINPKGVTLKEMEIA